MSASIDLTETALQNKERYIGRNLSTECGTAFHFIALSLALMHSTAKSVPYMVRLSPSFSMIVPSRNDLVTNPTCSINTPSDHSYINSWEFKWTKASLQLRNVPIFYYKQMYSIIRHRETNTEVLLVNTQRSLLSYDLIVNNGEKQVAIIFVHSGNREVMSYRYQDLTWHNV